jgi:hypothetical protein
MKIKGALSWTTAQQGGIGYPPLLVKVGRRWLWVEGSTEHGGSICRKCSVEFGKEMACIREILPSLPSRVRPRVGDWEYITWEEFKVLVKEQFGINGESGLTPDELAVKKCMVARLHLCRLGKIIDLPVEMRCGIDEVVGLLKRVSQECYQGKFKVKVKIKNKNKGVIR